LGIGVEADNDLITESRLSNLKSIYMDLLKDLHKIKSVLQENVSIGLYFHAETVQRLKWGKAHLKMMHPAPQWRNSVVNPPKS
jgi:hypothetical protein